MTNEAATEARRPSAAWWRWGRLVAGGVVVVGGLLATVSAVNAWGLRHGHGDGGGREACASADGASMGRGGVGGHAVMGGGMGWMASGGRGLERLLDDVDATQEQRQRIEQIAAAARTDLTALREQGQALREQQRALMASVDIDAAKAEQLRAGMVAHHDAVSRRMLASMLEMHKVLTPQQRARVAERLAARAERWRERRDERHERRQRERDGAPASAASRS